MSELYVGMNNNKYSHEKAKNLTARGLIFNPRYTGSNKIKKDRDV
jgi:hypothetical protein